MWIATTRGLGIIWGIPATIIGRMYWRNPHVATWHQIVMPANVHALKFTPEWSKYGDSLIGVGGWSENVILTKDWQLRTLGIRAPVVVPSVALSAGPGITSDNICYLAYYDERTDEWSPLSAPTAVLSPANQTLTWSTLPTPPNPRVTHIGLFRSVYGALPRLAMLVQRGCTTVVEATTLANMGPAWVDTFEQFPRCNLVVTWHDMIVMAGDMEHPNTIYFSIIGHPEKWGYLTLDTKSRQPVVALAVVRDQLLVFCPTATERISGWTEDDLSIEIAQPQLGCVSARGLQLIHENLWVPTHMGVFITDGNGWHLMMRDVRSKWESEFAKYQANYESSWSYHDPNQHIYALCVGIHTDTEDGTVGTVQTMYNTFWVADYSTIIPQAGGVMDQPRWSYDTEYSQACSCASQLAWPGGRRVDVWFGEAAQGTSGQGHLLKGGPFVAPLRILTGAEFGSDIGGDMAHGKRWTELDLMVRSEDDEWYFEVWTGHEEMTRRPLASVIAPYTVAPARYSETVAASSAHVHVGANTYLMEPQTVHLRPLPDVVGQAITLYLWCETPTTWDYRGYLAAWKEGPNPRWASTIYTPPV